MRLFRFITMVYLHSLKKIKTGLLAGLLFTLYTNRILALTPINNKDSVLTPNYNFKYTDARSFEILGQLPGIINYGRLPESAHAKVRGEVWISSRQSSGISIKFTTNSPVIKVKWNLMIGHSLGHMAALGVRGVDLYCHINKKWQYVESNSGSSMKNDETIAEGMDTTLKEFMLNLPLYEGILKLEIGIPEQFSINKPVKKTNEEQPILIYGTSITQGASASRPGMAYSSLLARSLNKNVINLGFSSNGIFEKALVEFILSAKPSVIVLDCVPNSSPEEIKKNLPELMAAIRSQDKKTPVLLIESIIREDSYFNKANMKYILEQNATLKLVYNELKSKGIRHLYYLSSKKLLGNDHEGTVDGTHPNDLGHYRLFIEIKKKLKKIIK